MGTCLVLKNSEQRDLGGLGTGRAVRVTMQAAGRQRETHVAGGQLRASQHSTEAPLVTGQVKTDPLIALGVPQATQESC